MGAVDTFRLSLTQYVDPADMRAWIDLAQPGDELIYATGPALGDHAAKHLAREWHEDGLVLLLSRRAARAGCFEYLCRKRCEAGQCLKTELDGPLALLNSAQFARSAEGRVYDYLVQICADGLPCPNNAEIAKAVRLRDHERARYRFNKLVDAGLIEVIEPARFSTRVIQITATGKRSAASHAEARR